MTPVQEYLGTLALLMITGLVMAIRRWRIKRSLTAEDLIGLAGHFSGLVVAIYIVAYAYKAVANEATPASLGVAQSVGGLIWGLVSVSGAYRLVWKPVAPSTLPPEEDAPSD